MIAAIVLDLPLSCQRLVYPGNNPHFVVNAEVLLYWELEDAAQNLSAAKLKSYSRSCRAAGKFEKLSKWPIECKGRSARTVTMRHTDNLTKLLALISFVS